MADLVGLLLAELERRRDAIERLIEQEEGREVVLEIGLNGAMRRISVSWRPRAQTLHKTDAA